MDNIIQSQITLVTFKAIKAEFNCRPSTKSDSPRFSIDLGNLVFEDKPNWFAKVFTIGLLAPGKGNEVIECDVIYHTVFECTNKIDSEFLNSDFAKISAPAIGFPYVRAFVSTVSLQAGLAPILLPSINFVQFSKEVDEQVASQANAPTK